MDSWCQSQLSVLWTAENTSIFCMAYACAPEKRDELGKLQYCICFLNNYQAILLIKVVCCINPAPYTRAYNYLKFLNPPQGKFKKLPVEHFQVLGGHLIDPVHRGPTRTIKMM